MDAPPPISPEQAERLRVAVARQLAYVGRLRKRMEEAGWRPEDSVYQATVRAHQALQELHVRVHYAACRTGVGRDARG